jgi:hypothetical protein
MKEKLKYGFLLLAAAVLLSACDFEHYQGRELSGTISVAPREISFGNALLKRAEFRISCMGDWIIIAPEALRVDPRLGTGDATVVVWGPSESSGPEASSGPATLTLYVCGTDVTIPVTVRLKETEESESQ